MAICSSTPRSPQEYKTGSGTVYIGQSQKPAKSSRKRTRDKPVSLHPLKFDQALKALADTPPEREKADQ